MVLLRRGSCQVRDGEQDPGTSPLSCPSASCFLLVLLLHAQAEWVDLNPSEMEQQMLQQAWKWIMIGWPKTESRIMKERSKQNLRRKNPSYKRIKWVPTKTHSPPLAK